MGGEGQDDSAERQRISCIVSAPAHFETARLRLTRPRQADAEEVFARYASDPVVTRYLGWPRHHTVTDTHSYLAWSDEQWSRHPAGPYLIRARADGELLGSTGLTFDDEGSAMTGYVLARDVWGRGLAAEALTGVIDIARTVGVQGLYAFCHPDHAASIRVLEKCRFVRDDSAVTTMTFPNLEPVVDLDVLCYRRWC
jgi:RimJ/RimL family protein N-acetyltransferase